MVAFRLGLSLALQTDNPLCQQYKSESNTLPLGAAVPGTTTHEGVIEMSIGKSKRVYRFFAVLVLVLILALGSLVSSHLHLQKLRYEMALTIQRLKTQRIFTPIVLKHMDTYEAFMYIWDTAPEEKALGIEYAHRVLREDPHFPEISTEESEEARFYLQHFDPVK